MTTRAVDAWLREVQLHQAEAREHAHCALEDIQRWAGLPAGEALSDALLVFENYPAAVAGDDVGELRLLDNNLTERNVFPFSLYISPRKGAQGERIDLVAAYDRRRFSPEAMDRVLDHFTRLLDGLGGGARAARRCSLSAARRGDARAGRGPAPGRRRCPDRRRRRARSTSG